MLSIDGLTGGYGAADEVVKGFHVAVKFGEVFTIIGPNGAGKSTALKLIAGLLTPKSGTKPTISLASDNLAGTTAQIRSRAGLVFVPQERNVFAALTVAENLMMGAYLEPGEANARAAIVYDQFPVLADKRRAMAGSLSGGQRQSLAMAIALMASPKVLLLDEPTAALAPNLAAEIFTLVRDIAERSIAVLMVEQNALAALSMSDSALVMVDGAVAIEGRAEDLRTDASVRQAFLGGRA